jgi:hypothetical protein
MAFTLVPGARHSLLPPEDGTSNDAAGFASCYGPHRSLPLAGLLTLGFDPARFQTGPPAGYRASWQLPGPDFHRQATTSLRTARFRCYVKASPPALLGARKAGARRRYPLGLIQPGQASTGEAPASWVVI